MHSLVLKRPLPFRLQTKQKKKGNEVNMKKSTLEESTEQNDSLCQQVNYQHSLGNCDSDHLIKRFQMQLVKDYLQIFTEPTHRSHLNSTILKGKGSMIKLEIIGM